jgi:hypothetical protein
MILAADVMDPTLKGVIWLIAIIFFLFAAFFAYSWRRDVPLWPSLVAVGLALFVIPWMYDAFAVA